MIARFSRSDRPVRSLTIPTLVFLRILFTIPALAQKNDNKQNLFFWPGNLVVSRSVYGNNPNNVTVGEILPPNCSSTQGGCGAPTGAPYNGSYPLVWNNDVYDASFGITSKIYLDQMLPFGFVIISLQVPNSSERGVAGEQRSAGKQLQFKVTAYSEPVAQWAIPDFFWIRLADRRDRHIELQHAWSSRYHESRRRKYVPLNRTSGPLRQFSVCRDERLQRK